MAQDKQKELKWELLNHLEGVQDTLRRLEEIADNAATVEAMREVVDRIVNVFHGPEEDIGLDRQMLANACVMLSYQALSEGYELPR